MEGEKLIRWLCQLIFCTNVCAVLGFGSVHKPAGDLSHLFIYSNVQIVSLSETEVGAVYAPCCTGLNCGYHTHAGAL